jgi:formylglycine-generating enzyme required for sulfatase activity
MLVIPPRGSADPPLFYMMENKVSNDLYRAFLDDKEASDALFAKYRRLQGSGKWFGGEWEKGANRPRDASSMGIVGRGSVPVFGLKVTEAHCFAEWLRGMLPQRKQWLKAVGDGEDTRPGPFNGTAADVAVLCEDGPWPVDKGENDVSIYGCRQMAGNGFEWTRTIQDGAEQIPMDRANGSRPVYVCGQSYKANTPLLFSGPKGFIVAGDLDSKSSDEGDPEITFRIVLEP